MYGPKAKWLKDNRALQTDAVNCIGIFPIAPVRSRDAWRLFAYARIYWNVNPHEWTIREDCENEFRRLAFVANCGNSLLQWLHMPHRISSLVVSRTGLQSVSFQTNSFLTCSKRSHHTLSVSPWHRSFDYHVVLWHHNRIRFSRSSSHCVYYSCHVTKGVLLLLLW